MILQPMDACDPTLLLALQDAAPCHLIDGHWVAASDSGTFETSDPASGAHLATLSRGTAEDIGRAVGSARAAFDHPAWRNLSPDARGRLLWRIGEAIEKDALRLATIEVLDQGKPLQVALGEIAGAAAQFRYYGGMANKIAGLAFQPSLAGLPDGHFASATVVPEPVGVVGAIVPWNSPMLMAAMKLAPAMAAGCTLVLKPAEQTSLSALALARIIQNIVSAADLPAGILNVVTGMGETAGRALVAHDDVDKIAFTGSTATGRAIVRAAAGNMKRLTLELGGKSPAIVMRDADLDRAAVGIARGMFSNSGQVCVAASRVLVASEVADAFLERFDKAARALTRAHGLDRPDLGPLVNVGHAEHVHRYVTDARNGGAEIVSGGEPPEGAFYRPTIVTNASVSRLAVEEVFGPVVAVSTFESIEEAISSANDTRFGLAASVWTRDLSTAHRTAALICAGTVWVNGHSHFSPELPKGGWRQSGWGTENGFAGLENYIQRKTICIIA